jgi:hypothetical protein
MGDLNFLAKGTDQAKASSGINVPSLNIVDSEINWIVTTGKIMSKFSGLSVLQVEQSENIIKNGRPWPWRCRMFLRGQSTSQKTRNMNELRKRKLSIWVDPPP